MINCYNNKQKTKKKTHTQFSKIRQLVRLWYLSHRRPATAQASLRIRAVSAEPSLFAYMKYGGRRRVRSKHHTLAGCACSLKNEFTEYEKCHNLMSWLNCLKVISHLILFASAHLLLPNSLFCNHRHRLLTM